MEYKLVTAPNLGIELIAPLKSLALNASSLQPSPLKDGYLMAIGHAIELAELIEARQRRKQEGK